MAEETENKIIAAHKAQQIRNAAPQLLEALTIVMLFYSNNLRDDIKQKCDAAIAAARGE